MIQLFTAASLLLLLASGCFLAGCGGSSPAGPSGSPASSGSHNPGRSCMECHSAGGDGPTFSVAGTVYRSDGVGTYAGATVRLTTEQAGGGVLVLSLETDGSGNFFTGQPVNFGSGLFTDVAGTASTRSMVAPVLDGSCNSCHDSSNRIVAN